MLQLQLFNLSVSGPADVFGLPSVLVGAKPYFANDPCATPFWLVSQATALFWRNAWAPLAG